MHQEQRQRQQRQRFQQHSHRHSAASRLACPNTEIDHSGFQMHDPEQNYYPELDIKNWPDPYEVCSCGYVPGAHFPTVDPAASRDASVTRIEAGTFNVWRPIPKQYTPVHKSEDEFTPTIGSCPCGSISCPRDTDPGLSLFKETTRKALDKLRRDLEENRNLLDHARQYGIRAQEGHNNTGYCLKCQTRMQREPEAMTEEDREFEEKMKVGRMEAAALYPGLFPPSFQYGVHESPPANTIPERFRESRPQRSTRSRVHQDGSAESP